MELKKSKKANLESKKHGFRLMGLVLVSAMVGMAFEYNDFTPIDEEIEVFNNPTIIECFEAPPVEEPPVEEEVITPPVPIIPDEPDLVDDDKDVDDFDFSDMDKDITEVPVITPPVLIPEDPYDFPDVDPTFVGGAAAMNQWIVDNVDYPELAREMGEQGKVYVKFVVDKKGNISKVSIRQGVSDALDAEAKRVVKKMPKWIPGEVDGKPVSVNFTLPIHFRLG
jgi:protein TonB